MEKTYGKNNLTIDQIHSNATDAKASSHTHYFTGKPCKHVHIAPRRVVDYICLECSRLRSVKYYKPSSRIKLTPEEKAAHKKAYYQANKAFHPNAKITGYMNDVLYEMSVDDFANIVAKQQPSPKE